CSDNISGLFPEDGTKLLGRSLQHIELLIGNNYSSGFIADLISSGTTNKSFEQINPYKITIKGDDYYLIISNASSYYLLEFEPVISDLDSDIQKLMGHSISRM